MSYTIFEALTILVGDVPSGLEPVLYIVCCLACIWLISQFFTVLWSFLLLLFGGGKR